VYTTVDGGHSIGPMPYPMVVNSHIV
jgi:hypothetical protein